MSNPADGPKKPGWARPVTLGCQVMVLGIVLIIAALIVRAATEVNAWTIWLASLGFGLAALGLLGAGVAGFVLTRRARAAFAGGLADEFESCPVDVPAVVAIEHARLAVVASKPGFPTQVVTSNVIPAHDVPTFLVTNAPRVRLRKGTDSQIEPAASYQWVRLPARIPQLLVGSDFRGQVALAGRDISIENEDFNRRFRVDSSIPGVTKGPSIDHDTFARYATAVLHPRAVDVLTRLPYGRTFVITEGLAAVIGPPVADLPDIRSCAAILADFAALLPHHVLQRWDGSTDYRPTH